MFENLFNYLYFFEFLYLASTVQEWFVHKYLMHTKQPNKSIFDNVYENHLLHHAKTNKDFTIKDGNPEYICVEFDTIDGVVQFIFMFGINTTFFYIIFHDNVPFVVISCSVFCFLMTNILVWNTLHAYVHGMDASEICYPKGLSRQYIEKIKDNVYVKWAIENHQAHHLNKNCNFNIVFPGADYILGTQRPFFQIE